MQSTLVAAYRATDYMVNGSGGIVVIQIGHYSLTVDRLLARMHARNAAFITAWNPFSKRLSFGANKHWGCELKRYLSVHGFVFLEGEGRGQTGEWPPEPSILAFGISRTEASTIGRRFRQNAIVFVRRGRPAELVMLRWVRWPAPLGCQAWTYTREWSVHSRSPDHRYAVRYPSLATLKSRHAAFATPASHIARAIRRTSSCSGPRSIKSPTKIICLSGCRKTPATSQ